MRYKASFGKDTDITKLRDDLESQGAEALYLSDKEDAILFDASSEVAKRIEKVSGVQDVVCAGD